MNFLKLLLSPKIPTISDYYKLYKKGLTFKYGKEFVTIKNIILDEKDTYINAFIYLDNGDRIILTEE